MLDPGGVAAVGCASAASGPTAPAHEPPRGPDVQRDRLDFAYKFLRLKERPCAPDTLDVCCQRRNRALDQAIASGDSERVAEAVDDVTLLCPELRNKAGETLGFSAPAITEAQAGRIEVRFAADVPETDRLYWASAFIDRRHPAGANVLPGKHQVSVEVHVVTSPGDESAQLTRVRLDRELDVPPRTQVKLTVTLRRQPGVDLREAFWLDPGKPELSPAGSGMSVEQASTKYRRRVRRPMFPEDLLATRPWMLSFRVCVDKQGRVETVSPIENVVHPRVFGPVLDSFLRARYVPPQVQGAAHRLLPPGPVRDHEVRLLTRARGPASGLSAMWRTQVSVRRQFFRPNPSVDGGSGH